MTTHALRGSIAALAAAAITTTMLVGTASPADAAAKVDRISGADRYLTGAQVSADAFASASVAYLATGQSFADALSAGAAAYANDGPVVLTTPGELTDAARDELRRLSPDRVVVVGGTVAISDAVVAAVRGDGRIGAEVERIGGDTRYHTAANVVTDAFPDAVDTVFVATGQSFPDALSGVPAAARFDAPLLLTEQGSLPAPTRAALQQLTPRRIVILGGEIAVSREVEDALEAYASDVDRLAGADRYDTGVEVAQDGFVGARTVYVATGRNFPDALAGGPAAGVNGGPLLLTDPNDLPDSVASELLRLNPRRVVILGGEAAVSRAVRDEIARVLSGGSALPSGRTPDLAFATVDNRDDAPTRGSQVVNVGTFDGAYETLTNPGDDYRDVDPLMSPDGRRLVFTRFADAGSDADLYLIDVAVGAGSTRKLFDMERRFGEDGCSDDELTWSPTGEQLAFICYPSDSGVAPSAHVVDLRGRTTEVALPGSADTRVFGLAYSPDGTELALSIYDPNEPSAEAASRIVAVDAAAAKDGATGTIANVPLDEFGFPEVAGQLHWSADGSTIVGEWGPSFRARLLVVDVDAGDATVRMSEGEHRVTGVTDDGSRALVVTDGDTDRLRLVPTAGGASTTIADGSVLEHGQIWTASIEGSRVVFDDLDGTFRAEQGNVWVSGLDASGRTRLFDVEGVINASPSLNPQRSGALAEPDERG